MTSYPHSLQPDRSAAYSSDSFPFSSDSSDPPLNGLLNPSIEILAAQYPKVAELQHLYQQLEQLYRSTNFDYQEANQELCSANQEACQYRLKIEELQKVIEKQNKLSEFVASLSGPNRPVRRPPQYNPRVLWTFTDLQNNWDACPSGSNPSRPSMSQCIQDRNRYIVGDDEYKAIWQTVDSTYKALLAPLQPKMSGLHDRTDLIENHHDIWTRALEMLQEHHEVYPHLHHKHPQWFSQCHNPAALTLVPQTTPAVLTQAPLQIAQTFQVMQDANVHAPATPKLPNINILLVTVKSDATNLLDLFTTEFADITVARSKC
ncbi:hypothetical protein FA15DRAFT_710494 [Coprinopsis marcescibilis]|uniref:Uncharacterized protein n=1 Tax=Coprinopsis marcescibilis TaxID=230819 RepID=A0A5C3KCD3_COPMA|nr:hypothetical protein FA15DRAFT_710494 [Coprinopsis marcescibilis]